MRQNPLRHRILCICHVVAPRTIVGVKMHSFGVSILCELCAIVLCILLVAGAAGSASTDTFVVPIVVRELPDSSPKNALDENGDPLFLGPFHYMMKLNIFPEIQGSSDDIGALSGDFLIDTGSSVAVMYHQGTDGEPQACESLYEERNVLNHTAPDISNYDLASEDSTMCKEFDYSIENPMNNTCLFQVVYAGGEEIEGFVVQNAYMFMDSSRKVLGSSSEISGDKTLINTLTSMNGGSFPLYSPLIVGRIDRATSCSAFPGIMGMDTSKSSFVTQLATQGKIGGNVFSLCLSRTGLNDGNDQEDGIVIMGPGNPSHIAGMLSAFPLYNGITIQDIKTESQEFEDAIASLKERGLSSHFFIILDNITVGNLTFPGPLDTLVDSGYEALAFRSDISNAIQQQIVLNIKSKGYSVDIQGQCITVDNLTNEEALAIVEEVSPTIRLALSNTMSYDVKGIDYMNVIEVSPQQFQLCNAVGASESNEMAVLGTSFFIDRFVQFDWDNQELRIADITVCPSSNASSDLFTVVNSTAMSGGYSFPYEKQTSSVGVLARPGPGHQLVTISMIIISALLL